MGELGGIGESLEAPCSCQRQFGSHLKAVRCKQGEQLDDIASVSTYVSGAKDVSRVRLIYWGFFNTLEGF
jgi:hypothetical protein